MEKTQGELLIEQLTNQTYHCMICSEIIRRSARTWSCQVCFNVFHMDCVRNWAAKCMQDKTVWRCPSCNNETNTFPSTYRCFCGKVVDPPHNGFDVPHSCGEICHQVMACKHLCIRPCHPGPHAKCTMVIDTSCYCGKKTEKSACHLVSGGQSCGQVCDRLLNCGKHRCVRVCHVGECDTCEVVVQQQCHCERETRETFCYAGWEQRYSCKTTCARSLKCAQHTCDRLCHPPSPGDHPCMPCPRSLDVITHCPCGKYRLQDLRASPRKSCADPVPCCPEKCDKAFPCGPIGADSVVSPKDIHRCQSRCHDGPCPPCKLQTAMACLCGRKQEKMSCAKAMEFISGRKEFRCQKKCNKYKDCGKHKCQELCCQRAQHTCDQLCRRMLDCGQNHRCERLCHVDACGACPHVSMEPLSCHCGAEVILPPVPCGTRAPLCGKPCSRVHSCSHPVQHTCHNDADCPPCTAFTQPLCLGGHVFMNNVACFLGRISCGVTCGHSLACGHTCTRSCHDGDCVNSATTGSGCGQLCGRKHPSGCSHGCQAPCHPDSECPQLQSCNHQQGVSCNCGHRQERMACSRATKLLEAARDGEAQRLVASGRTFSEFEWRQEVLRLQRTVTFFTLLPCDEACSRLLHFSAQALEALSLGSNPPAALNPPPVAVYSPALRDFAARHHDFARDVVAKLGVLVQQAAAVSKKTAANAPTYRRLDFANLNPDERRFVAELAAMYGCKWESSGKEAVRPLAVLAFAGQSRAPCPPLTELVQAPRAQPTRPPKPSIAATMAGGGSGDWARGTLHSRFGAADSAERPASVWAVD